MLQVKEVSIWYSTKARKNNTVHQANVCENGTLFWNPDWVRYKV